MARMISAALLLGVMLATSSLQAEEPACQRCEVGAPILSKIPYINRLYKNVGVAASDACKNGSCPAQATCEELPCPVGAGGAAGVSLPGVGQCFRIIGDDGLERIGVDFDFNVQCTEAGCVDGTCPTAACSKVVCSEAACNNTACSDCPTKQVNAELVAAVETQSAILEAYAGFSAELDALRDKYEEQKSELIDAVVEAQIENAKLAAKLEFAEERQKLLVEHAVAQLQLATAAEMGEKLQAENEELKTRLAAAGADLPSTSKLSQENASLKAKLKKLEARLAKQEAAAEETAEKPVIKRKR